MTDHFGSEEAALSSLKSGDIGQIAEMRAFLQKRALALARSIAGDDVATLLPLKRTLLNFINSSLIKLLIFTASPATKLKTTNRLLP